MDNQETKANMYHIFCDGVDLGVFKEDAAFDLIEELLQDGRFVKVEEIV